MTSRPCWICSLGSRRADSGCGATSTRGRGRRSANSVRRISGSWPGSRPRASTGGWVAGGVTPEILEEVRATDPARLDPHSGAALFWWLRTGLYFSRGLDARPEVRLVSYADVLDDPRAALTAICGHLGIDPVPAMWSDVSAQLSAAKSGAESELPLAPKVRDLCDELTARLRAATPAAPA
ncbi:hypothetical protein, partial [Nostocoides jenkinsii]|uniref:hypothetical protein n=1 Tax=Nostocoides jenkinsii TaxID=330834 RepID=UPI00138E3F9D